MRVLPVTSWYQCGYGTDSIRRRLEVPSWGEITGNYAEPTAEALARLMSFRPGAAGRLLLWHGLPGTCKTYAIRALGWEWREWCDLHYVTDPETMFGSDPWHRAGAAGPRVEKPRCDMPGRSFPRAMPGAGRGWRPPRA